MTRQLAQYDTSVTIAYGYAYDAFGNLIDSTGTSDNAYGFTGEQQFGEADNLVFLRARYYSPSIGRFISRDPILEPMRVGDNFVWFLPYLVDIPQSLHSYKYCENNPVNNIDPEGMLTWTVIVLCGIAIVFFAFTLRCLWKIHKFNKKWKKIKKESGVCDSQDGCDTQGKWKKATKTKEWSDMIKACGIPNYVG